jgi:hypothetical protein
MLDQFLYCETNGMAGAIPHGDIHNFNSRVCATVIPRQGEPLAVGDYYVCRLCRAGDDGPDGSNNKLGERKSRWLLSLRLLVILNVLLYYWFNFFSCGSTVL